MISFGKYFIKNSYWKYIKKKFWGLFFMWPYRSNIIKKRQDAPLGSHLISFYVNKICVLSENKSAQHQDHYNIICTADLNLNKTMKSWKKVIELCNLYLFFSQIVSRCLLKIALFRKYFLTVIIIFLNSEKINFDILRPNPEI